jgi:uncharacterized membrane protein YphA (DoxX/SURF4 family)
MPNLSSALWPLWAARAFVSVFFAILFLQSGLDKVVDWKGNQSWLSGHFAKSPLRAFVPHMLGVITVLEVLAGVMSLIGFLQVVFNGKTGLATSGLFLACTALCSLFFGQRMAKDYAGAAALVPYFLAGLFGLFLMRGASGAA